MEIFDLVINKLKYFRYILRQKFCTALLGSNDESKTNRVFMHLRSPIHYWKAFLIIRCRQTKPSREFTICIYNISQRSFSFGIGIVIIIRYTNFLKYFSHIKLFTNKCKIIGRFINSYNYIFFLQFSQIFLYVWLTQNRIGFMKMKGFFKKFRLVFNLINDFIFPILEFSFRKRRLFGHVFNASF